MYQISPMNWMMIFYVMMFMMKSIFQTMLCIEENYYKKMMKIKMYVK
nr:ATP synthase F0 subunit 8 [Stigmaeopsis nanjingensis]WKW93588.1 ATP synthase F0 subunit 8 [Stigmaeopsis nanjingensis]